MKRLVLFFSFLLMNGISFSMEADVVNGYSKVCVEGYPDAHPKSPFQEDKYTYYFVPAEFQIRIIGIRTNMPTPKHCFVLLSPEKELYVNQEILNYQDEKGHQARVDAYIDNLKSQINILESADKDDTDPYMENELENKKVLLQVLKDMKSAELNQIQDVIRFFNEMKKDAKD